MWNRNMDGYPKNRYLVIPRIILFRRDPVKLDRG